MTLEESKEHIRRFSNGLCGMVDKIYYDHEAEIKEFNKVVEETHFANELEYKKRLKAKEEADYKIGAWLSAALEDSSICDEFRKDIEFWFSFQKV